MTYAEAQAAEILEALAKLTSFERERLRLFVKSRAELKEAREAIQEHENRVGWVRSRLPQLEEEAKSAEAKISELLNSE